MNPKYLNRKVRITTSTVDALRFLYVFILVRIMSIFLGQRLELASIGMQKVTYVFSIKKISRHAFARSSVSRNAIRARNTGCIVSGAPPRALLKPTPTLMIFSVEYRGTGAFVYVYIL